MSGMDWEKDPELRALRREFVQSFAERARALRAAGPDVRKIELIVHKLAGAARSYGFEDIGNLAERAEDLAAAGGGVELSSLVSRLCVLLETPPAGF